MITTLESRDGCRNLVLGTVQLGLPYGVANTTGQPDQTVATAIIAAAWASGVRCFDTAQAYGSSEQVLGTALAAQPNSSEARIVSKLKTSRGAAEVADLLLQVRSSLERLRQPSLWGVLLHDEDDLDHWDGSLGRAFAEVRAAGLVRSVGVSVYSPERALQALQCAGIDLVQVPANLFDRRMERAGVYRRAAAMDKQIFIRSVYLQGLALMTPDQVRTRMPFALQASMHLHEFCGRFGVSPQRFAIDHACRQNPQAMVIIGAETVEQVCENCALFAAPALPGDLHDLWAKEWPEDCLDLIDPRKWAALKRNPT